jgi:hypothetical protein
MQSLDALQLFYDGPVPAQERDAARLGSAASLHRTMEAARERFLETGAHRAARALAGGRGQHQPADLQDELMRFRRMALACRERLLP